MTQMTTSTVDERQTRRMNADREELAERIARAVPRDGLADPQPGLNLARFARPTELHHGFLDGPVAVPIDHEIGRITALVANCGQEQLSLIHCWSMAFVNRSLRRLSASATPRPSRSLAMASPNSAATSAHRE